jgi:hypothetical protein
MSCDMMHEAGTLQGEDGRLRVFGRHIVREIWHYRLSRWLPRLVWRDDEIDVTITWRDDPLRPDRDSFRQLFSGRLYEIELMLHEMGISFDTGMGCDGRDWEFDFSLSGPVSIKFRSRAKRPERRHAGRSRMTLVT